MLREDARRSPDEVPPLAELLREGGIFQDVDGKPVHALFMVVSPTAPLHLRILAALGFALRDSAFREMLGSDADVAEILISLDLIEKSR